MEFICHQKIVKQVKLKTNMGPMLEILPQLGSPSEVPGSNLVSKGLLTMSKGFQDWSSIQQIIKITNFHYVARLFYVQINSTMKVAKNICYTPVLNRPSLPCIAGYIR